MMPIMDGYAVLRALQQEARTTLIPFVFLTASSDPLQVRAGLDLGAIDYLCKPVPKAKLLTTIQHCLGNRNLPGHGPEGSAGPVGPSEN
jgi:CheY-like chemotaxis protein